MPSEEVRMLASSAVSDPNQRRLRLATGLSLAFLEWGADDGQRDHTLILVHGFLDLAWGFAPMVEHGLGRQFHVVAPDMRGHGDSDRVGAGGYYHFMDYVADLASLVDQVGRTRVSIAGHSMGGSVAAYFAGSFPERVHRLALLEGLGPPLDDTPLPARTAAWVASWRRVRESEGRGHPSLAAAAARMRAVDPLLGEELALYLAERGTRELVDGSRQFKHDPLHLTRGPYPFQLATAEQFWRSIRCPVLLVEGAESPFRQLESLEARVACLEQAERVVLPGAAHMMQRHQPEATARVLTEFFTRS